MKSTRFEKRAKIYRALASGIINEDEVVIDQPIGTLKYPRVAKGLYVASPSGFLVVGDPLYVTGGKPQCYVPEIADETFAEHGGYHRPANPVLEDCGYYLHAHQLVLCHPMTNEVAICTRTFFPSLFVFLFPFVNCHVSMSVAYAYACSKAQIV
ncbi:pseudouridine synthase family protein [Artemisia annua]|uniref:Pseudouridine synthase family protein n=1 Tax=Artemisia annua TaxID=35608 RepID=A0A2U1PRN0_ARTAN|nr:pseudouridine synthase family protein [Artemisia annua]